jgi:ParB family chromosome partitioning protein
VSGPDTLLFLDPDTIDVADRLRWVDPARVDEIAVSMGEIGQLEPIGVGFDPATKRHRLIFGAHRLAAVKRAGLDTVKAINFDGTADQNRLREIDENLFRAELTPYDQAAFLAERRLIFERINGRVKPGRRSAGRTTGNLSQLSFFDEVTGKFGLSRTVIERALKRHGRISNDLWTQLRGHPVCKIATEIDKLARLDDAEQRRVVRLMMQDTLPAKNVTAALRALSDKPIEDADARQFRRLTEAWSKAGPKARAKFEVFLMRAASVGGV